jgi:hypothetical protein
VLPADTAELQPGWYTWTAIAVTLAGARFTVASGKFRILQDPTQAAPGDNLTHNEKMKAAIEAVLEGRATADIELYTIDGRQITKIPFHDLRKAYAVYAAAVERARRGNRLSTAVEVVFAPPS